MDRNQARQLISEWRRHLEGDAAERADLVPGVVMRGLVTLVPDDAHAAVTMDAHGRGTLAASDGFALYRGEIDVEEGDPPLVVSVSRVPFDSAMPTVTVRQRWLTDSDSDETFMLRTWRFDFGSRGTYEATSRIAWSAREERPLPEQLATEIGWELPDLGSF